MAGLAPLACDLYSSTEPPESKKPHTVLCSVLAEVKLFKILEQEGLHFDFMLGPANYVASPG